VRKSSQWFEECHGVVNGTHKKMEARASLSCFSNLGIGKENYL